MSSPHSSASPYGSAAAAQRPTEAHLVDSAKALAPAHTSGSADMANAFTLKTTLRKAMLRTLRAIPAGDLQSQSAQVFSILRDQPFYAAAKAVGCYLSMGKGELQTGDIVADLLSRGSKLYTPYLPPVLSTTSSPNDSQPSNTHTPMQMLRLYSTADLALCPLDKWGIQDPGGSRRDTGEKRQDALDSDAPELDVILIPGVAFDEDCNRLGRGKAYYDRYLASYTSRRPRPLLVALALQCQLLPPGERVPTTPDDFTLDGVITPDRIIWREGVARNA